MKFKLSIAIFLSVLTLACSEDDFPVTLEITQVERLLTADSSKVWIPAENAGFLACEMDNKLTFTVAEDQEEPGILKKETGTALCEEEDGEPIEGFFEVTSTPSQINRLTLYTSDTLTFDIALITASRLELTLKDQTQELIFKTASEN